MELGFWLRKECVETWKREGVWDVGKTEKGLWLRGRAWAVSGWRERLVRLTRPSGSSTESGFGPQGCGLQEFSSYSLSMPVECPSVCLVCVLWKYLLAPNVLTLWAENLREPDEEEVVLWTWVEAHSVGVNAASLPWNVCSVWFETSPWEKVGPLERWCPTCPSRWPWGRRCSGQVRV